MISRLAVLLFCLLPAVAAAQEPDFPPLTGRVVDAAEILSPATENALTLRLRDWESESADQIVVVTVPDLQGLEIEDYGYRLGREWGIGQAEGEEGRGLDNGAILLVAPNEREVRIEVGYGLEPVLTDAMSSAIIRKEILPEFRRGDFGEGVTRGVIGMIDVLRGDEAGVLDRRARAGGRAVAEGEGGFPWPVLILLFFFLSRFLGGGRRRGGFGSRRRRYRSGADVLPWIVASQAGRRGGFTAGGGGFGGGGFGGGGGFSGGGGSFGGGGASGSW